MKYDLLLFESMNYIQFVSGGDLFEGMHLQFESLSESLCVLLL